MNLYLVVAEPGRLRAVIAALHGTDVRPVLPCAALFHSAASPDELHARVGSGTILSQLDGSWRI